MAVGGVDDTRAADLVDISAFYRDNMGYKFHLNIINVFSKYDWLIPLKDKKDANVRDALGSVFKEETPTKLWADKKTSQGSETATAKAWYLALLYRIRQEVGCGRTCN